MLKSLEGISMKVVIRVQRMTVEEINALLVGVRRDIKDCSIHAYSSM